MAVIVAVVVIAMGAVLVVVAVGVFVLDRNLVVPFLVEPFAERGGVLRFDLFFVRVDVSREEALGVFVEIEDFYERFEIGESAITLVLEQLRRSQPDTTVFDCRDDLLGEAIEVLVVPMQ